ncbi:MAG: TauD/TfdA family dioxygenase [Pseudomonadota bacterium]
MSENGYKRITVNPLSGCVGAEIGGVNLSDVDDETFAEIHRAFLAHLVIFFRGQTLDDDGLLALSNRFGPPFRHPNFIPDPDRPEIVRIRTEPDDVKIVGVEWHTDTTCMREPPLGAVLYAIETPPVGGDTLFANQYAAYESLSPAYQEMLSQMTAVHSDRRVAGPRSGVSGGRTSKVREDTEWTETLNHHPVVRTHPETGRKGLFVNRAYTVQFTDMTEAESAPILEQLLQHAARPEFTCRFSWKRGSVAIWDNRCLMHIAIHDYAGHRREMHRVQIAGDRPQ